MKKRISILTATRAEYGLLKPLIKKLSMEDDFDTRLVVTGAHLSPEFGLTYQEIESDGIVIDKKIEILLSADTPSAISKSMGLAMISFADYFEDLRPDMLVVLGDRYETLAVASAAMNQRIPIVHLYGGETTEGAIDESIRHAITKLSYLHFTSTEEYRNRVIQLGEDPCRVFNVGAISIENIKNLKLISKEEFEADINFKFGEKTALVTFHPVTLEDNTSENQFKNLLDAFDEIKELKVIFTKANSDTDGRIINEMINDYVNENRDKSIAFASMGQPRYHIAMKYVDVVIGNSSSGIVEAPSFKVPTVNIGDRQKGRLQASSIINCMPVTSDIIKAIKHAYSEEFKKKARDTVNPYGSGTTSDIIVETIKSFIYGNKIDLKKKFHDINFEVK